MPDWPLVIWLLWIPPPCLTGPLVTWLLWIPPPCLTDPLRRSSVCCGFSECSLKTQLKKGFGHAKVWHQDRNTLATQLADNGCSIMANADLCCFWPIKWWPVFYVTHPFLCVVLSWTSIMQVHMTILYRACNQDWFWGGLGLLKSKLFFKIYLFIIYLFIYLFIYFYFFQIFVSPERSSERDYVITDSVCSMCMYVVCMCMYVVIFAKIDHCIHIHWCIPMGLGHNDPWVESHMWPQ